MTRKKGTSPGTGTSEKETAVDSEGVVSARQRFQRLGEDLQSRYRKVSEDVRRGAERASAEIRSGAEPARGRHDEVTESARFLELVKENPGPITVVVGLALGWLLGMRLRRRTGRPSLEQSWPASEVQVRGYEKASPKVRIYLQARGLSIEPEDLPPLLEGALNEMRCRLYPEEPAADLPVGETAALRRGGFTMEPADGGSSSALARSMAEYAALRETSLTVGEAALRLGVDPIQVRQLLTDRKLYGLQVEGTWRIPAFQLVGDRLVPGLAEVVPALPKDLHPVAVYHWFTEPNPDLVSEEEERRLSPREWLLAGSPPQAVAGLAADLDSL